MTPNVLWMVIGEWIGAFAFTVACEVPFYALVLRRRVRLRDAVPAAAACSLLTHPLLWFVWPRVVAYYTTYIISGELLVTLIESLVVLALLRGAGPKRAFAAAFLANAASWGGGLALRWLGVL